VRCATHSDRRPDDKELSDNAQKVAFVRPEPTCCWKWKEMGLLCAQLPSSLGGPSRSSQVRRAHQKQERVQCCDRDPIQTSKVIILSSNPPHPRPKPHIPQPLPVCLFSSRNPHFTTSFPKQYLRFKLSSSSQSNPSRISIFSFLVCTISLRSTSAIIWTCLKR